MHTPIIARSSWIYIDIDPGAVVAKKPDARWLRVVGTHADAYSVMLVAIIGFIDPRYKQTNLVTGSVT